MIRSVKIAGVFVALLFMDETAHASGPSDVSPFNWSGTYLGVSVAHSWLDLKYYEPDWPGFDRNPDINGFTGGAFLGYNYQIDNILLGVEGDAGVGDLSEDADKSATNTYSAYDIDWNAHIRARIGCVFDTTLLYVAGGLAFAEVTVDDTDPNWGKDDATHAGWTVGAGIEHGMTKNLRARLEYLYDDYGNKDYTITGLYSYRANVDLTAHTVRAGLSYCF